MYKSANPFDLLDDGNDTPAAAPAPKQTPAAAAPAAAPKAAAKPRGEYAGRGAPRKVFQGDREVNTEGASVGEQAKEDRANTFGGRGGARGGRGGRGGANPRSNGGTYLGGDRPRRENGGGRPFDRHSATAHKDTDKTEAAGWGAEEGTKELQAEVEGEADAKVETGAVTPVAAKSEWAPAVVEEEEDNTQTYDEYLAEQAAKKLSLGLPTLEVRNANEGADETQWKDAVKLAKKGEAEEDWFLGTKKTEPTKARKAKDTKTFLEIEVNFKPPRRDGPPREGGDRGGRGGGRGGSRGRGEGRGRGAPRGDFAPRGGAPRAPRAAAVNVNDSAAFPTLA